MGAMESLRWHSWHLAWRMGATSFAKVGAAEAEGAWAKAALTNNAAKAGSAITEIFMAAPGEQSGLEAEGLRRQFISNRSWVPGLGAIDRDYSCQSSKRCAA